MRRDPIGNACISCMLRACMHASRRHDACTAEQCSLFHCRRTVYGVAQADFCARHCRCYLSSTVHARLPWRRYHATTSLHVPTAHGATVLVNDDFHDFEHALCTGDFSIGPPILLHIFALSTSLLLQTSPRVQPILAFCLRFRFTCLAYWPLL